MILPKNHVIYTLLTIFSLNNAHATTTALFEDFEDSTITYGLFELDLLAVDNLGTAFTGDSDLPTLDYIDRIAYTDSPQTINNQLGLSYFGAEDFDSVNSIISTLGSSLPDAAVMQFSGIDVSNFGTDFTFSAFWAEADISGSEDWDATDSVTVWARLDGGAFTQVFGIESQGSADPALVNNTIARVDANLDGVGEGAEITNALTEYEVDLGSALGSGNNLDVQIRIIGLGATGEDIAIDNVSVVGVVPEPSSLMLLSSIGFLALCRRSRRRDDKS